MGKAEHPNKTHVRKDFIQCKQRCRLCDILKPAGSKILNSNYNLKYHLTTEHNKEDELCAGITRRQILQTAKAISLGLEWNMLVEIPKEKTT